MPGSDWNGGEEKGNRGKRKWIAGEGRRVKTKRKKKRNWEKRKRVKRERRKIKTEDKWNKKDHNGSQTGGCPAPTYGRAAWPFGQPRPFRSEEVKDE